MRAAAVALAALVAAAPAAGQAPSSGQDKVIDVRSRSAAAGNSFEALWAAQKRAERKGDVVGSQNDAMALGAQRALRAQHPEWTGVRYTGCDGLADGGQRLVQIGQLSATIVVPSCGGPAVELLDHAFLTGNPPPLSLVVPPRSFPPVEELGPALAT